MDCLNQSIRVITWQEEVTLIGRLPDMLVDNTLRFVIDVVHTRIDRLMLLRVLRMENREGPQIEEMQETTIGILLHHSELSLPHNTTNRINHIVLLE